MTEPGEPEPEVDTGVDSGPLFGLGEPLRSEEPFVLGPLPPLPPTAEELQAVQRQSAASAIAAAQRGKAQRERCRNAAEISRARKTVAVMEAKVAAAQKNIELRASLSEMEAQLAELRRRRASAPSLLAPLLSAVQRCACLPRPAEAEQCAEQRMVNAITSDAIGQGIDDRVWLDDGAKLT